MICTPEKDESLDVFVDRYWAEYRKIYPPHAKECMCLGCNGQYDEVPYGIYEDWHEVRSTRQD
jgi:hypothetical protein